MCSSPGDNGLTWARQSVAPDTIYFNGIDCTDASTCWVAGTEGQIDHTLNGGSTWQRQSPTIPYQVTFNRIHMADATHGYAVGCTDTDPESGDCLGVGAIYRTTNGVDWVALQLFTYDASMGLYVFSMDDVFAIDWGGIVWHYSGQTPLATATLGADPSRDVHAYADSHIHADADADADPHVHADPDADADPDTDGHPDCHADHRRHQRRHLQ